MARGELMGLFREPEQVAAALDQLRGLGFAGRSLQVVSAAPYPVGAFGEEDEEHHLYVFPLVGAACGFAFGILVTVGTQLAYPLVTYGMPILAIPPSINVVFEGTMLGALLFTFAGVLFESRLPAFGALSDPRISAGYLGVLVQTSDDRRALAAAALRAAGAVDLVAEAPR